MNLSGGAIPTNGISLNGGVGGDDALIVMGYNLPTADGVADVTVTHLSSDSGTVAFTSLGNISFDEIEPLTIVGNAADLVITLPAGADSISLGDDGGPQEINGNTANTSALYDSTGPAFSFEFTEFTNPINSLTINLMSESLTPGTRRLPSGASNALPAFGSVTALELHASSSTTNELARRIRATRTAAMQPSLTSTQPLYADVTMLKLSGTAKHVEDDFTVGGVFLD